MTTLLEGSIHGLTHDDKSHMAHNAHWPGCARKDLLDARYVTGSVDFCTILRLRYQN
jgi:hypothetical protein